jgi:hypothetical protein
MRIPRSFICGLIALLLAGCMSRFSERHFFKSEDAYGNPVNYYKLSVSGANFLSSTRYLSGYFDEKAVDAYFNQFSQPDKGLFEGTIKAEGTNIRPVDDVLGTRKLVLLLSSNSDAIAQQIGQFANNEAIMGDLTRLIYRDHIKEAQSARTSAELQEMRGKALSDIGDNVIGGLSDDATKEAAEAHLLFYANRLATEFENTIPFKNLDEAKIWLEYNRSHIQGSRQ